MVILYVRDPPFFLRISELGCYELSRPLYGVLVYNGTLVEESQPEWQENDTVTFQCARGFELIGPSGFAFGAEWNVTCEASDIDAGSASSTTDSDITWSEEPQEFTCSSKFNAPLILTLIIIHLQV